MDRGGPSLVPEWYKPVNGGGANSNNNHVGSSVHSEDHAARSSSRSRFLSGADTHRPLGDRSLSSQGSSSANGSANREKESHPYSSFGRSRRDRDRERELDSRGRNRVRDRLSLLDNGHYEHSDSLKTSSKDRSRRSHSMVSGRQIESSWIKQPGNDPRNGVVIGGSSVSGFHKSSFERDFPSLGTEEKQRVPDRVLSPRLSTTIQIPPLASSTVIGADGWASALVDMPTPQTSSTTGGLNMAEALAQAPSRARTPPQLSIDTQRMEELTLRQCKQLIPVTPSMPKTSILSSLDKSKPKGARVDISGPSKVVPPSSQLVNHNLRASPRPDTPRTSQAGNFQVLNRERNGISPSAKDVANVNRTVSSLITGSTATFPPVKSPLSPNLRGDNKGTAFSFTPNFGEKKPLIQAQKRNDFFNALRKKTSANHSSSTQEPSCHVSAPCSDKSDEQSSRTCASADQENNSSTSDHCPGFLIDNGDGAIGVCDACQGPCGCIFDNEENISDEDLAFMKSLGWEENGRDEALTTEEIRDFVKEKYEKLRPSLKQQYRDLWPLP